MEPITYTEPTVSNISITVVSGNSSQGTFSVDVAGTSVTAVKVNSMTAQNNEPAPSSGQIPKVLTKTSGTNTWTGVITYSRALATRTSNAYTGNLKITYSSSETNDSITTSKPSYTTGVS